MMVSSNRRSRQLAAEKRKRQLARHRNQSSSLRNVGFVVALLIILVVVIGYASGQSIDTQPTASLSPSASSTYVSLCDPVPTPNPSPSQWASPPKAEDLKGTYLWTLKTNCGEIIIEVDSNNAPVTANSMKFLSEAGFFNGSACHRLTTSGIFVLQCGDPTGTGAGSSGYKIVEENLPTTNPAVYETGIVAMANSGQPQTSGSQFFLVYQDTQLAPTYTIFGKIVKGLEIVKLIADVGVIGGGIDGSPQQNISIKSTEFVKKKN